MVHVLGQRVFLAAANVVQSWLIICTCCRSAAAIPPSYRRHLLLPPIAFFCEALSNLGIAPTQITVGCRLCGYEDFLEYLEDIIGTNFGLSNLIVVYRIRLWFIKFDCG